MEYKQMQFCEKITIRNKQQLDERRRTTLREVYAKLNEQIEKERE